MTKDLFRLRKFCENNHYQDILNELELFSQATGEDRLERYESLFDLIYKLPEDHQRYVKRKITALGIDNFETAKIPNNGKAV